MKKILIIIGTLALVAWIGFTQLQSPNLIDNGSLEGCAVPDGAIVTTNFVAGINHGRPSVTNGVVALVRTNGNTVLLWDSNHMGTAILNPMGKLPAGKYLLRATVKYYLSYPDDLLQIQKFVKVCDPNEFQLDGKEDVAKVEGLGSLGDLVFAPNIFEIITKGWTVTADDFTLTRL